MKSTFYCKCCDKKFEKVPLEKEYNDHVFGPCKFFYSICPECGSECREIKQPSLKNNESSSIKNNKSVCCNCNCCCD